MTTMSNWVAGARPRTLPAAVAPVVAGSVVAYWQQSFNLPLALLALVVALALQVGVNYANDYSDGVRGTDSQRIGPTRLVGQGLATAAKVKQAAMLAFLVAALAGLALTWLSGYWIFILIGLLAIWSAWGYTGGSRPYGYAGFGELFVFVWFGLVAVLGTVYAQTGQITGFAVLVAATSGSYACALLVVNNLRDLDGDKAVGKRTLAVRLGDFNTRRLFAALAWFGSIAGIGIVGFSLNDPTGWPYLAVLGSMGGAYVSRPVQRIRAGAVGADLIVALGETTRAQLLWAALLTVGVVGQTALS